MIVQQVLLLIIRLCQPESRKNGAGSVINVLLRAKLSLSGTLNVLQTPSTWRRLNLAFNNISPALNSAFQRFHSSALHLSVHIYTPILARTSRDCLEIYIELFFPANASPPVVKILQMLWSLSSNAVKTSLLCNASWVSGPGVFLEILDLWLQNPPRHYQSSWESSIGEQSFRPNEMYMG